MALCFLKVTLNAEWMRKMIDEERALKKRGLLAP